MDDRRWAILRVKRLEVVQVPIGFWPPLLLPPPRTTPGPWPFPPCPSLTDSVPSSQGQLSSKSKSPAAAVALELHSSRARARVLCCKCVVSGTGLGDHVGGSGGVLLVRCLSRGRQQKRQDDNLAKGKGSDQRTVCRKEVRVLWPVAAPRRSGRESEGGRGDCLGDARGDRGVPVRGPKRGGSRSRGRGGH